MQTNRRHFLVATGLSAVAAGRAMGANDMIRVGAIGCGGRMRSVLSGLDQSPGTALVAGCDVYQPRMEEIHLRTDGVATMHGNYREVLDRKDIDAVLIATPDHWHVRIASEAIAAGKDVYLEKPVTHKLEEGEVLTHAVRASKQVLQCGMQQRSWIHFQSAVDLIQGGSIGRVTQIRTYWFQNYQSSMLGEPTDLKLLDWKQWLGSAPPQDFSEEKVRRWRWFWDFGGGAMTDLFSHWIDVAHWAMKVHAPTQATALGDTYFFDQWQCPDTIEATFRYAGFQVGYDGTMVSSIDDGGLEFRGTDGTLKITRGGFSIYREGRRVDNPALMERSLGDGTITHVQNFVNCMRSRKEPNAPVEAGVAAAQAGHIGNLALRRGERVVWRGPGSLKG
jgi:predicted dehydrogenase